MTHDAKVEENLEDKAASVTPQRRVDYAHVLARFHRLMAGVTLIGLALIYVRFGLDHLLPFSLGSGLVWLNMTILARGLGGVLNGEKSLAILLLLKFGLLVLALRNKIPTLRRSCLESRPCQPAT